MKKWLIVCCALLATPAAAQYDFTPTSPSYSMTMGAIAATDNDRPRAGYCRYEGVANWWHMVLTCYRRNKDGKLVRYYARGR